MKALSACIGDALWTPRPAAVGGRVEILEPRVLLSSIAGTVWQDLDADGVRDPGEPGHAGVTVYLDQNRNGQLDAGEIIQISGSDGVYQFNGLQSGFYTVAEVPPPAWHQTAPALRASEPIEWVNLDGVLDGVAIHDQFSNGYVSMSADGRYVAFSSRASVVPHGEPIIEQVYVLDRQTLLVDHVSANYAGNMGNDRSFAPAISADGRFVAFQSYASNLVPDDTNGATDVFVYDRSTRTIERVSLSADGAQANNISFGASISADGRYVAFTSTATNLTQAGGGRIAQVYVFDRQRRSVECDSLTTSGDPANGDSSGRLTPDGRYVVITSDADNLVPGDTNGCSDVFVFDRQTGMLDRVSIGGAAAEANGSSYGSSISADGRYVAFQSSASNLVPDDTNGATDVFVFDRLMRTVTRANVNFTVGQANGGASSASISADGRYIAFQSTETDLALPYQGQYPGVFVYDQQTGRVARVSASATGLPANNQAFSPLISGDGRHVTFWSWATNLDPSAQIILDDCDQLYMAPNPLAPANQAHEMLLWPGRDVSNVDLGNYGTAEIRGTVFRDLNGNGVRDPDDQAIAGAQVYVDTDGDAERDGNEPTALTGLDGSYVLVGVLSGVHNVRVVEPTGFRQTLPTQQPEATERVSVSTGVEANGESRGAAVSANGRFVAFTSNASNLIPASTNGSSNVFVFDRQSRAIECVSVDAAARQPRGGSSAYISADGRYVAFSSDSGDLVPNDTNRRVDAYVFDLLESRIEIASVTSAGISGNGNSAACGISADGRYVLIVSEASNLVSDDRNPLRDFFVHNMLTGGTTCVSISSAGLPANNDNWRWGAISADGRYVAFESRASNLVNGDTNSNTDIFVFDRGMARTERVSINSAGVQANSESGEPSISADGRYVVFSSYASNLVLGDTNECSDIFVFDRQRRTIERVSVNSADGEANGGSHAPSISADGRYVAFESSATNLVAGDTNDRVDVFVFDRRTGRTTRVNVSSAEEQANGDSRTPSISADGHFVAFESDASTLVGADTNAVRDIFIAPTARASRPAAHRVTVGMGQVAEGTNFVLEQTALLWGRVWNDRNVNDAGEPEEPGIGGVLIRLYRDNGNGLFEADGRDQQLAEGTTTNDGTFFYEDLQPGDYWVWVDSSAPVLDGFRSSGANAPRLLTVTASEHVSIGSFGYYRPIIVTSPNDEVDGQDGKTSLREALALARETPGWDVIGFAPDVSGTIRLDPKLGQLALDSNVIIEGLGANRLSLDAGGGSRVIYVGSGIEARISGLTISGGGTNYGAGIYLAEGASVTLSGMAVESCIATQKGGGIYAGFGTTLTITESTLSENSAATGGGIYSEGILTISNTTIAHNKASVDGGGMYVRENSTLLTNATISENRANSDGNGTGAGGGIYNDVGLLTMHNTIIAGNLVSPGTDKQSADDLSGPVESGSSHNLIGTGKGSSGLQAGANGNQVGIAWADVGLMPLDNYGGSTKTYALRVDSPAIDAGDNAKAIAAGSDMDQRGMTRIVKHHGVGEAKVDIGAYEAPPPIVVNTAEDEETPGDGLLSLREALKQAAQSPGLDVIQLLPDLAKDAQAAIQLSVGELVIQSDVDIQGRKDAKLTIDAGHASRVFRIEQGVSAWIRALTLSGGAADKGGGIYNSGNLTVDHALLTGNAASDQGGAIYNAGALTLLDSTVSGNQANGDGGGICSAAESLLAVNVTVYNNDADADSNGTGKGGGIMVLGGTAKLYNTVVAGNTPDDVGGSFLPDGHHDFIGTLVGSVGLEGGTSLRTGSPMLVDLGYYDDHQSGPTRIHAIANALSLLIDGGDNKVAKDYGLDTDQCYQWRFGDGSDSGVQDPVVDIGAFELQQKLNSRPVITPANIGGAKEDIDFTIPYDVLRHSSDARDDDGDIVSFRIDAVKSGTLVFNGSVISPEALADVSQRPIVRPGQSLVWTPPEDIDFGGKTTAEFAAFAVSAWDGKAASTTSVDVKIEVVSAGEAVNYAVLFSGGIDSKNNQPYYRDAVQKLYKVLVDKLYVKRWNIQVFFADGNLGTVLGVEPEQQPLVKVATHDGLKEALIDLADQVDSNDHFFFWTFDHGSLGEVVGDAALAGWGADQYISDRELRAWLLGLRAGDDPQTLDVDPDYRGIQAGYTTYLFGQCYSGGMLDDLNLGGSSSGRSAFGMAAAKANERSTTDVFVSAFTDALSTCEYTQEAFSTAMKKANPDLRSEHPFSIGENFRIFARRATNAPAPQLEKAYPIEIQANQSSLEITHDMLMAATGTAGPTSEPVRFRILSEDVGQLYKDGHRIDLGNPDDTFVGISQVVTWYRPAGMSSGTANAFRLAVLDEFGDPVGDGIAVPIRVASSGRFPKATNDLQPLVQNSHNRNVKVLANDEGNSLHVVSVGFASGGKVMLDALTGTVHYTPDTGFLGGDSFSYVVADQSGETDMATVTVVVLPYDPESLRPLFLQAEATDLPAAPGWAGLPESWRSYIANYKETTGTDWPDWSESEGLDISEDGTVAVGLSREDIPKGGGSWHDMYFAGGTGAGYCWKAGDEAPYWIMTADGRYTDTNVVMMLNKLVLDQTVVTHTCWDGSDRVVYHGLKALSMQNPNAVASIEYWDPDNAGTEGRWPGRIWSYGQPDTPPWPDVPLDRLPVDLGPLSSGSARSVASAASTGYLTAVTYRGDGTTTKRYAQIYRVSTVGMSLVFDLLANMATLPGWDGMAGASSIAEAISASGDLIGHAQYSQDSWHAFLYHADAMRDLGVLDGYSHSNAVAINASGQVAGFCSNTSPSDLGIDSAYTGNDDRDRTSVAFVWDAVGGMKKLGTLPSFDGSERWSTAYDINDSGAIVGASSGRAFIWFNGTMYDLNVLVHRATALDDPEGLPYNVTLIAATGINNHGQIVATGCTPNGLKHAYYLHLDLADNDCIFPGGNLAQVAEQIKSAQLIGRSKAYTTLAAVLNDKGDGTTIKTSFAGQSVLATDVLVKYTWDGDANLDGVINADDYFQIDSGYITQAKGYHNGDFNYDGVINADDYFLIDSAYIGQSGTLAAGSAGNPINVVASEQAVVIQRQMSNGEQEPTMLQQLFSNRPVSCVLSYACLDLQLKCN